MLKRFTLLTLLMVAVLVPGYGESNKGKILIPVDRTDPTNGKQMFVNYCAPCHGTDGRGYGPAAPALKVQPVNLTTLARVNHGKFPDAHLSAVLQGGSTLPAHGSAEMPVWGPILGNMNHGNPQERQLRIVNLSSYIRSIQTR